MLPLVLTLTASGPLVDVRAADVDGDGVDELVMASASGSGDAHGLTLEVVSFGPQGERSRARYALPAKPAWWDAGHGLWVVDSGGLRRVDQDKRVTPRATGLPSAAPATPAHAGLVCDLNHDGVAELLVQTTDAVLVVEESGRLWGVAPAPPRVEMGASARHGGQVSAVSLIPPALAVADLNGDGLDELLVINEREVTAYGLVGGSLVPAGRFPLPRLLTHPAPDTEITWARWADLNGDGRADLLVHRLRGGTLADTEAELHLFLGTGSLGTGDALKPAGVQPTGAGSAEAYLVDLDGDGGLEVLVPQVPLDVSNLAQAVFDRSVEVQLVVMPVVNGRLGPPKPLGDMRLPIEESAAAWSMFEDLSGDGLPDLAVAVNGELQLWRGGGLSLAKEPWVTLNLGLKATHLWALDLTGDGAAELVAWAPGERSLVWVRLL